jgi:hypothetical protein
MIWSVACNGLNHWGPDVGSRTIMFVQQGCQVLWTAAGTQQSAPTLLAADGDLMVELLHQFVAIFAEPTSLPPPRDHFLQIHLLPGAAPVAIQPYCYTHGQKLELKQQCVNILHVGVVHPSTSTFSAPVLLVKKSDESWHFYVIYRALNSHTIKDKFPNLVVEELLDELCGATFFTKLDLCFGYHQVRMHAC